MPVMADNDSRPDVVEDLTDGTSHGPENEDGGTTEDGGVGDDVSIPARKPSCNLAAVAANARKLGSSTRTRHECLPAAREAFKMAGCRVPSGFRGNAPASFAALSHSFWHCERTGPRSAPNGAAIFYVGCGSHHTEVKAGDCFYSDFHHPDCLPASEYRTCRYTPIGWCTP